MQGYYALIQYSEFPERFEYVNIGVVLFADAYPRVFIKFANSASRVEKTFGVRLGKHFQLLKESMENRLYSEFSEYWHKDILDRFSMMRTGKIRLSPSKSILVKDPNTDIDNLFERLVGGIERQPREQRIGIKLRKQLELHEVETLLDKPSPISLPQGVTVKAPYAYQNGSYNLINAISLREEPDLALKNASAQATEGKWLYEDSRDQSNKKRLIVVADLDGQPHNFRSAVKELMEDNHVGFFALENLGPLVADIRRNVVGDASGPSLYPI